MDWGKGIVLLLIAFVLFMSTLVYMSVNQDFYLVTDNYYTEGINYDEVQEKIGNFKRLEKKIEISQVDENINIQIPTEVTEGSIHFFRPSNGTLDFRVPIVDNDFYVDKTKVKKGRWLLKFSWSDGEKQYYIEESISIL